jgi:hypothetical protein
MKATLFIGLFILIFSHQVLAFGILQPNGGRTTSLGNCSVALNDFWSCHNTPAGFASMKEISIGISYHNKFMIKELGYKNAGILFPLNLGVIGVSFSQFGYNLYNENIIGLGFARNFGDKLRIGIKLDYLFFNFSDEYEDQSVPTFELGLQYQINESLCLGAYIFNPINVKLKTINRDKIPVIMRLGLSYYLNEAFLITSEIEENFEYDFSYRFGLEYEIYKNILLRSGFQFNPGLFTFGIGYNYHKYIIDICAQMNQTLGASLNCSFIFKIKSRRATI